jgi:hypothetical protein
VLLVAAALKKLHWEERNKDIDEFLIFFFLFPGTHRHTSVK